MSVESDIEWTDATWNPTRGCTKISPGCKHCYAEAFAERFRGVEGHPYEDGFDPRMVRDQLALPLTWKKPRRIFVDSMSDLFMAEVPDEYIAAVFGVMSYTRRHTFQVLTKRASRMRAWPRWLAEQAPTALERWVRQVAVAEQLCGEPVGSRGAASTDGRARVVSEHARALVIERRNACITAFYPDWPPPNVHLGVSVEDRKHGLPRIDELREVPAALRFLSVEPLLEDLGALDLTGIGWVIVGGESGNGARPLNVGWVRRIVEQCREQRVPVFVKQLGRAPTMESGLVPLRLARRKGNEPSEWPEDLRVRQMPEVHHA